LTKSFFQIPLQFKQTLRDLAVLLGKFPSEIIRLNKSPFENFLFDLKIFAVTEDLDVAGRKTVEAQLIEKYAKLYT